jgi:hypothetical protein
VLGLSPSITKEDFDYYWDILCLDKTVAPDDLDDFFNSIGR